MHNECNAGFSQTGYDDQTEFLIYLFMRPLFIRQQETKHRTATALNPHVAITFSFKPGLAAEKYPRVATKRDIMYYAK